MRRKKPIVSFVLVCGAAAALLACSNTEQSGACNGTEDGTYWQMQVYNYYTTPLEVRVNGRFVGNVGAGTTNVTDGTITPAQAQLGEFPVCDALVTEARGTGIQTTKACSNPNFTSTKCHNEKPDYCWTTFIATDPGTQPTPPLIQPQCTDPTNYPDCADAWKPC